jgi:cytochrome oxidase Cu insertion factor (SCO1/SenC/PrrC family)
MVSTVRCSSCGHEVAAPQEASPAIACPACGQALAPAQATSGVASPAHPARRPNRSMAVKVWVSVLLLALAAYGGVTLWRIYDRRYRETPSNMAVERAGFNVGDFELTERSGRTFHSRELAGQIWVASFFFRACPNGQCPRLNHAIGDLLEGDLANEPVKFVSITVDPANDTPDMLAAYADLFIKPRGIDQDRWLFLTQAQGSDEVIGAICQSRFRVSYAKAAHWAKVILVDQQGTVRGHYSSDDPVDLKRLQRKIQELRQQPPAEKAPGERPSGKTATQGGASQASTPTSAG